MVGEDTTDTAVAGQSSLSYPEATASSYIAIGSWKFAHKLFFPLYFPWSIPGLASSLPASPPEGFLFFTENREASYPSKLT